jgi:hypothetical protein
MRNKIAAFSGLAVLAATTGVLLSATSASAIKCPVPTKPGAVVDFTQCMTGGQIPPGCDPGPCDPTAVAPRD